jgi:hypothetical protein
MRVQHRSAYRSVDDYHGRAVADREQRAGVLAAARTRG